MGTSSKSVTVGYKYNLGAHLVLCQGEIDKLSEIKVDDNLAWKGDVKDGQLYIDKPDLFGGQDREGGIVGYADVMSGTPTQAVNSYLSSKISGLLPAFRGYSSVILKSMYIGNVPYMKKWAFKIQRILKTSESSAQWYEAKAAIPHTVDDIYTWDDFNSWLEPTAPSWAVATALPDFEFISKVSFSFLFENTSTTNQTTFAICDTSYNVLVGFLPINAGGVPTLYKRDSIYNQFGAFTSPLEVGNIYTVSFEFSSTSFYTASLYKNGTFVETVNPPSTTMLNFKYLALAKYDYSNIELPSNSTFASAELVLNSDIYNMNPAHIIRECITDKGYGMGYSDLEIDDTSFTNAADTLYTEKFGLSFLWNKETSIEDFIKDVLRHIDGSLLVNPSTGKFELKLVRNDYNVGSIPHITEDYIIDVSDFDKKTLGKLVTSVSVKYKDTELQQDVTVTVHNPAVAFAQNKENPITIEYAGIRNQELASKIAQRDLKTLSSFIVTATIEVPLYSVSESVRLGDVIKVTFSPLNLNQRVMRVTSKSRGDGIKHSIVLGLVDDVFATPNEAILNISPVKWNDGSTAPVPAEHYSVIEAPYWELVQRSGQANVDNELTNNPDAGYLITSAAKVGSAYKFKFNVDGGELLNADFSPHGVLSSDISYLDTTLSFSGYNNLAGVKVGTYCQIEDEICRVDSVGTSSVTVGRGCLDTVPSIHLTGASVLFSDEYGETNNVEYAESESVSVKILPVTPKETLNENLAPSIAFTFNSRAYKPYPPGNVKVNNSYYPSEIGNSDLLTLTWAHRNRLQQTSGDIYDFTDGDIGPESGVTYNIDLYNENNVLVKQVTGLTTTTYEWTTEVDDSLVYDENASDAALAMHFDGTNGSTTFIDEGFYSHTVTAYGNAQISTSNYKSTPSSGYFDGVNSYLSVPDHSSLDLSDIYTIEFWVRPTQFTDCAIIDKAYFDSSGAEPFWGGLSTTVFMLSNGFTRIYFYATDGNDAQYLDFTSPFTLNAWTHCAIVKDGVDGRVYFNGVLAGSITGLNNPAPNAYDLKIGRWEASSGYYYFKGYIDELRITNGDALYNANFTPEVRFANGGSPQYRLNNQLTYELWAEREGLDSIQKHTYTVNRASS